MKKYTMFLVAFAFVFGLFNINVDFTSAQTGTTPVGCQLGYVYSPTTGQLCSTRSRGVSRPSTTPVIYSILPAGCTSIEGYSYLTGEACTNNRSEANFEDLVYIFGKDFGGVYVRTQSTTDGSYISLPTNFISSALLSFKVPSGAGSGRHDIWLKKTNDDTFLSNSISLSFIKVPVARTLPVISGVKGPQSLEVNKQGIWSVSASDEGGGSLSYSVSWGDEGSQTTSGLVTTTPAQQSVTFTHSYSRAGTYYPTFTVTNEAGRSAKTSISVKVGETSSFADITIRPVNRKEKIYKSGQNDVILAEFNFLSSPKADDVTFSGFNFWGFMADANGEYYKYSPSYPTHFKNFLLEADGKAISQGKVSSDGVIYFPDSE